MYLETKLKKRAKEIGFTDRDLEDAICNLIKDEKLQEADDINQSGINSQLRYLRRIYFKSPITKLIDLNESIIDSILSVIGQSS